MTLEMILTATFIAATAIALMIAQLLLRDDKRTLERLGSLSSRGGGKTLLRPGSRLRSATSLVSRSLTGKSGQTSTDEDSGHRRLQTQLLHAGIYSPSALGIFIVAKVTLVLLPPVICFIGAEMGLISARMVIAYSTLGCALGMFIPSMWLERRKARRHATLNRSLPDFLDLMVACVESGLSMNAALQRVVDELQNAHPILAGELSAVQRQVQLGGTLEAALFHFAERTDLDAIQSLATVIQQSQRFGTSIADALRTHADVLRTQREQSAEELAQKAAVKILFPTLMLIFPATFVVLAGPAVIQLNEKFSAKPESHSRVKR